MHPTRRLHRTLLFALAAALLAAPASAVDVGDEAPNFSAKVLRGRDQLSLADYRGKVVYLDFWASWCAPCAVALPVLDSFRKEFSSEGFEVLAVNVDSDPAKALNFLSLRPVDYPSVADPKGELPQRFGVETMPTSFLIDRNGVVRRVHRGFKKSDETELRNEIRKLLGSGR